MLRSAIRWLLLTGVVVSSLLMYYPDIYGNDMFYMQVRNIVFMLLGALSLVTFSFRRCMQTPFVRRSFYIILFFAFEMFAFFAFSLRVNWSDMIQIIMVFMFVIIGLGMKANTRTLLFLCALYSIGALLLGSVSLDTYLGGFDIYADQYLIDGKNQLGAIVATGAGTAFLTSQMIKSKLKYGFLGIAVVTFFILLTIRCRTASAAFVLLVALYILKNWTFRKKIAFFVFMLLLVIVFYNQISDFFTQAITAGKDIEDMDSLSTHRFDRNVAGFDYFMSHFFTGELLRSANLEYIHNYLLLRAVRYGIWVLPLVVLFLYYVIKFTVMIIREINDFVGLGFYILIIPFACSLLEPSAPFGPGSVYMVAYILFGISLSNKYVFEEIE